MNKAKNKSFWVLCIRPIILLLYGLWPVVAVYAQEEGKIPFRKITYKEYQGGTTIWQVFQDSRGIIYAGCSNYIVCYDGNNWEVIQREDNGGLTFARSFYEDANGRVYAFGDQTMGYFVKNPSGKLVFRQIIEHLPVDAQQYAIGTAIMPMSDGIYFGSTDWIARWNGKNFDKVYYPPKARFTRSFLVKDRIFVRETGTGIHELNTKQEKLNYIGGSAIFQEERISFMKNMPDGKILIGTRTAGLYVMDLAETDTSKRFVKMDSGVDDLLKVRNIYDCLRMPDGNILVNLFTGGVVLLSPQGLFLRWIFDTETFVSSCFLDSSDQLWLSTNDGAIYRLDMAASYRVWKTGEAGTPLGVPIWVKRFQGKIYSGTSNALLVLKNNTFQAIPMRTTQVLSALEATFGNEKQLLVGTFDGIYRVEGDKAAQIIKTSPVVQIFSLPLFPNFLFAYERDGLFVSEYRNKKWQPRQSLSEWGRIQIVYNRSFGTPFRYEPSTKSLWVETNDYFIRFSWAEPYQLMNCVSEQVPKKVLENGAESPLAYCFLDDDKLVFRSETAYYTYNFQQKKHFRYDKFGKNYFYKAPFYMNNVTQLVPNEKYAIGLNQLGNGALINFKRLDLISKQPDGRYAIDSTTHQYLPQEPSIDNFADGDSLIWVVYNDFILRYDLRQPTQKKSSFKLYIREVRQDKRTLFGGVSCGADSIPKFTQDNNDKIVLDYSQSTIFFSFSGYSVPEDKNLYAYRLDGYDAPNAWSEWGSQTKKEYTNLAEGTYTFYVKGKNIYGLESNTATFTFRIRPPWYRTWLAYLSYIILAALVIGAAVYWNTRRLLRASLKLKALVAKRTYEIEKQKDEIASQRDNLMQLNEEINQQREEIQITAENLTAANLQISKKNEDIIASINYAKRIQNAILPSQERMHSAVGKKRLFVLFKPKDIVSGDFYFLEQLGQHTFIAAADCTGHGVPGAFMSMVSTQLLHKIIVKDAVFEPDQVLNALDKELRLTLHHNETNTNDGLDISLLVFTKNQEEILFASAMQSILLFDYQENSWIFSEIKGTKRGIGGQLNYKEITRSFELHRFLIKQKACVYLFSDGYADQFGGPEAKKYMTKRLKNQLEAFYQNPLTPLEQQAEILNANIEAWRGESHEKQTDDILVIGLRLGQWNDDKQAKP